MALWTFEFYRVRNGVDPMFCIKEEEKVYEDGTVGECIGIGYKVYKYNRNFLHGTEFVSIFAKERDNSEFYNKEDDTESNENTELENTESTEKVSE